MGLEPNGLMQAMIVLVFAGFGAWEGGLIGWMQESYQIKPFHRALESGCCLLTVDVPGCQVEDARNAMARLGIKQPAREDSSWIYPFHRKVA